MQLNVKLTHTRIKYADVRLPDPEVHWREIFDEPDDYPLPPGPRFPSATTKPEKLPENGKLAIYLLFVELIKLSEIFGRIQQGIYSPKAQLTSTEQGSDAIVSQLDFELTQWRLAFPNTIKQANFPDFDEGTGCFAPVIGKDIKTWTACLLIALIT